MRIRPYLKACVQDPLAAVRFALFGREYVVKCQIKKIVGASLDKVDRVYAELDRRKDLHEHLQTELTLAGRTPLNIGALDNTSELYALIKLIKPQKVVETGVAAGVSSAYILAAMEENGEGDLYSIDMPNYQVYCFPHNKLPQNKEPGFAIPKELRHRWHFTQGLTKEKLVPLLRELGNIDIFLHDSEHTYENMMFEFNVAWSHLTDGAILVSDDVAWNSAFDDFARRVKSKQIKLWFTRLGCIRKQPSN